MRPADIAGHCKPLHIIASHCKLFQTPFAQND